MVDRTKCVPVIPGGECPNCGWSTAAPYLPGAPGIPEPHELLAHGVPKLGAVGVCANCNMGWNLDAVKCSHCGFEPAYAEAYDRLLVEKNKFRKAQFLHALPPRPMPITTTADVG